MSGSGSWQQQSCFRKAQIHLLNYMPTATAFCRCRPGQ